MKTPEQGAATSVWCATSPQLEGPGGVDCEESDTAIPMPGDSKELRDVRPRAMDREFARERWNLSERLTGAHCPSVHGISSASACAISLRGNRREYKASNVYRELA
jgi:hypothetical protein